MGLIPLVDECLDGCTPKITGLNLVSVQGDSEGTNPPVKYYSKVTEMERADYTTTSVVAEANATTTVESASASRVTPGWPAAPRLPWCKAQSQARRLKYE